VIFLSLSLLLMDRLSHVAIALANSAAAAAQLALLLWSLRRHTGELGLSSVLVSTLRLGLLAAAAAAAVFGLASRLDFGPAHGELTRAAWYAALLALGGGVFLLGAAVLRAPELGALRAALARRRARRAL
jgi:peptidoglycan biosynthesis protein MviN/MurJ (putative lipid II flippase)